MPMVFRSMLSEGNRPLVGDTAQTLGVRTGTVSRPDIAVSADGTVEPRGQGMSVVLAWRFLPPHRIPARLYRQGKCRDARGKDELVCWRMGDGPFVRGPVSDGLQLCPDSGADPKHGVIEPSHEMPLGDYRAKLAATRDLWVVDEA
jgi:hypothetical protein